MTRLTLHIGLPHCGAARLQSVLVANRAALAQSGVLFSEYPGNQNHTRLFMAATDPDHVEPFRYHRGRADPAAQAELTDTLKARLAREVTQAKPDHIILSAWQLSTLSTPSEIARLHSLVSPLADDIRVLAVVDEQARVLARHYASQVLDGRIGDLSAEHELAQSDSWHQAALDVGEGAKPEHHAFPEIQTPPAWLDYQQVFAIWADLFGAKNIRLEPYDPTALLGPNTHETVQNMFDIPAPLTPIAPAKDTQLPSAQWLTHARHVNSLLHAVQVHGLHIPPRLRKRIMQRLAAPGPDIPAGALHAVSERFKADNAKLATQYPALKQALNPEAKVDDWQEPAPANGFRASQYLAVFMPAIDRQQPPDGPSSAGSAKSSAPKDRTPLPKLARENLEKLLTTRFAPHDQIGPRNVDAVKTPFPVMPPRELPKGQSGRVIVGCMKNEAPYILEWVAYHRTIGFDNFLIYTNDCTDHTEEILNRLQELGIVQHRDNSNWKGNSPQQYALNQSLKEDVIKQAEWIAHIDVDEFVSINPGNGTLDDLFAAVPNATNIAMTWRLFGHNGVTAFEDRPVIAQFDHAAPRYCPKPHTVWGFKTMFRNIGAYAKISCHRPNKLRDGAREHVKWVNGSGQPMKADYANKGWRSDVKSIGYDLVQLNHYALRSMDSFLIKRQRGRALHVDRSVGLNYWIRMDWNDHADRAIQRNLDRMTHQYDALLDDPKLDGLHKAGVNWHKAKAKELRATPEFAKLRAQASKIHLNSAERVAWALALDMDA